MSGEVRVELRDALLASLRDGALDEAVADGVPSALVGQDATLWGPAAAAEASVRLGWLAAPRVSAGLPARVAELRAELATDGVDRVVLAGMGGSSLAPEVICADAGVELVVLDTTDPGQVARALTDLERTVLVVSSKSGSTIETDSHRRTFAAAFEAAGLPAGQRLVVVTDPGSPLEQVARDGGYREVFLADPDVGGRYSALTAFGLVPAGLAGAPVADLLAQARAVEDALGRLQANPGLELGALLGGAGRGGHDKVVLAEAGSTGLGDWIEQLLAESTGKQGKGLLPVVVGGPDAPGTGPVGDSLLVQLGGGAPERGVGVSGPLGAQFLVWEFATALAGRLLGINPFDQPNVTESKENTARVLEAGLPAERPLLEDGPVQVYASDAGVLAGAADLAGVLTALLAGIAPHGYLAVMAYLDRGADAAAAQLRAALAQRTERPVTFGWGPRFLHSTGQYHKGGPQDGSFLQLTGAAASDVAIPGRPYGFATLQLAQAAGDREALESRARPFVRLHLRDRAAGIAHLLRAAGA